MVFFWIGKEDVQVLFSHLGEASLEVRNVSCKMGKRKERRKEKKRQQNREKERKQQCESRKRDNSWIEWGLEVQLGLIEAD